MNFFFKYFWGPVLADALNHPIDGIHEGYNIYNTLVYAAALIFFAYVTYIALRKRKVKIDRDFFLALVPFGVLGALWRVSEDLMLIPMPWTVLFITPIIYFLIYGIAAIPMLIFRNKKYTMYTGITLVGISSIFVFFRQWVHTIGWGIPLIAAVVSFPWLLYKGYFGKLENVFILFAHMVDAFATYISYKFFGYGEKHVFTSLILKESPVSYLFIKYFLILAVVYSLKDFDDEPRIYTVTILGVIGLATGLRDTFRLILGV